MPSQKIKKIEEMIKERSALKNEVSRLESKIFKVENEYLELTQGCPLLRNLEFYIHAKPEKKRANIEEDDRVFSTSFPTQKTL